MADFKVGDKIRGKIGHVKDNIYTITRLYSGPVLFSTDNLPRTNELTWDIEDYVAGRFEKIDSEIPNKIDTKE